MTKTKPFVPHDLDAGNSVAVRDGYYLMMMKQHPHAHKHTGYVYIQRLVMENKLGRFLEPNEQVWHQDGHRWNNDPDNLELEAPPKIGNRTCAHCGKEFRCTNSRIRHCSPKCGNLSLHRCAHPEKDELQRFVWMLPTIHLAADYGISDVAVAKWCRKLEVKKPPRGYWQKLRVGRCVRSMIPLSIVKLFGGVSAVIESAAV